MQFTRVAHSMKDTNLQFIQLWVAVIFLSLVFRKPRDFSNLAVIFTTMLA
mgnify:FL=1